MKARLSVKQSRGDSLVSHRSDFLESLSLMASGEVSKQITYLKMTVINFMSYGISHFRAS